MKRLRTPRHSPTRRLGQQQRGVVLLFALIALTVMLIAAVALSRSFQTSLFAAGNIGFKRDMRNESEIAVSTALSSFGTTGGLGTTTARANNSSQYNYSATMLPTDPAGIPTDLVLSDAAFAAKYSAGDLPSPIQTDSVTKIRYVIDRLCSAVGNEKTLGSNSCVLSNNPIPAGQNLLELKNADSTPLCPTCESSTPQAVVYRLSVWVRGPRSTQSFFQSTFNVPS